MRLSLSGAQSRRPESLWLLVAATAVCCCCRSKFIFVLCTHLNILFYLYCYCYICTTLVVFIFVSHSPPLTPSLSLFLSLHLQKAAALERRPDCSCYELPYSHHALRSWIRNDVHLRYEFNGNSSSSTVLTAFLRANVYTRIICRKKKTQNQNIFLSFPHFFPSLF